MSLLRALSYSLLAHGVLLTLWWLPARFDFDRGRPAAMQAMLSPAMPAKGAGAQTSKPAGRTASPLSIPSHEAFASPSVLPPQAPAALAEASAKQASAVASLPAPVAESSRPVETAPAQEMRSGISAEGLRQYQYALARETRRHYQYPPLARERGWEGRVEVRIGVVPGQRPAVGLLRSSGHEILDEQALSMVGKALLAVALPDSLRGYSFSVPVPFEFSLKDD